MLLRASIILAYLMMTLLSSGSGYACSEMNAEMLTQSGETTSISSQNMHSHDMHSEASSSQDNSLHDNSLHDSSSHEKIASASPTTNSGMQNCDGVCLITCMACSASIQEAQVLLATAKFHNDPIREDIADQVLAAHNAKNLRPPIS